ncbi:MAG: CHASE3 domain-containing protein [Flavobacteriales bacterium]|nr:CHASE3 domain-containing protein [Flavobacteriales bacterium]
MQELRKDREERRLTTMLYIAAMAVLLALLYATYQNIRTYSSTVAEVRMHGTALSELEGLLSSLQDAETGVRGYQLTKDTAFLEPYRLANRRLRDHLARLGLYQMNATDSLGLEELRRLTGHLGELWRSMVYNNVDAIVGSPSMVYDLRVAKAYMDSVRVVQDRLVGDRIERRDLLLDREREEGVDAPFMLVIYSLLALFATALLFWRLSRTLRFNEQVRLALRSKVKALDHEVTQRARLQNQLQQVLDVSPSGIMAFRSIRDAEGRIIDFEWLSSNRTANGTVGRTDLVGKRLLEEMPENRTHGLFDDYVRTVQEGSPSVKEFQYTGSGLNNWFRHHAVKLDDGFMVMFSDITEQKRAEMINQETDRLELTAQLTRTVAHEVRNPLTNIHLALEQIQDELEGKEEEVGPYFAIVDRNLKRIGTLIKEMLESSRKRELDLAPCRMEDIVDDVIRSVGDRLALREMGHAVAIADELPEVMADCELINLALTNIAVNAVEAMQTGKGFLRFTVALDTDAVVLSISDNGKGISPENLQRLFEPFYSGRPGGLGLGLTTARSILHSHGIHLDVSSIVGEGTTFSLRFPSGTFA